MSLNEIRLRLFPDTTTIEHDTLVIGGQTLPSLAETYKTPLYVYDRATMDASVARYKHALRAHYPGASFITYAGKAFLCKAIAQWVAQQRLWLDCTGEGEISIARAGGLSPSSMVSHGVNKSAADLDAAIQHTGTIVVDNLSETGRIAVRLGPAGVLNRNKIVPSLWLRLQPGIAVATHHPHTQTGQSDSKFGMTPAEILEAARMIRAAGLSLGGLHFHLGSDFHETEPLVAAIELAVELAYQMGLGNPWHLCPGGGWSVAYHEDELPQPDVDDYIRVIGREVTRACRKHNLELPILHIEPGRSLVARAGVAIYRVGTAKRRKDKTWLLTDGGMTDNPRFALYGSRYSCLPVHGLGRDAVERVSIAGPYCESGDVIIEDLVMPRIEEGELLAVPVAGAYQLSMSSNYNGARRPAAVWLENGRPRLIMRRETLDELAQRDLSIT
jgi:diaminopimelate decarboxylase